MLHQDEGTYRGENELQINCLHTLFFSLSTQLTITVNGNVASVTFLGLSVRIIHLLALLESERSVMCTNLVIAF